MCFRQLQPLLQSYDYLLEGKTEIEPIVKEIRRLNRSIDRIHVLLRLFVCVHISCLGIFLLLAIAIIPFAVAYVGRIDYNANDINKFYNTEVKPMVKNTHAIINRTQSTLRKLGIDPFDEFVEAVDFIRSDNVTEIALNVEDMMLDLYKSLVKPTTTRKLFNIHLVDAFVSLVPALRSALSATVTPKSSWMYVSALIQNCKITMIGNYGDGNEERNKEVFEDMLYIDEIYYWLYYNLDYAQSLTDQGKVSYMTGSPTNKWGELKDFNAYNDGSGAYLLRAEFSKHAMEPLVSYKNVGIEVRFPTKVEYDKFLSAAADRTLTY